MLNLQLNNLKQRKFQTNNENLDEFIGNRQSGNEEHARAYYAVNEKYKKPKSITDNTEQYLLYPLKLTKKQDRLINKRKLSTIFSKSDHNNTDVKLRKNFDRSIIKSHQLPCDGTLLIDPIEFPDFKRDKAQKNVFNDYSENKTFKIRTVQIRPFHDRKHLFHPLLEYKYHFGSIISRPWWKERDCYTIESNQAWNKFYFPKMFHLYPVTTRNFNYHYLRYRHNPLYRKLLDSFAEQPIIGKRMKSEAKFDKTLVENITHENLWEVERKHLKNVININYIRDILEWRQRKTNVLHSPDDNLKNVDKDVSSLNIGVKDSTINQTDQAAFKSVKDTGIFPKEHRNIMLNGMVFNRPLFSDIVEAPSDKHLEKYTYKDDESVISDIFSNDDTVSSDRTSPIWTEKVNFREFMGKPKYYKPKFIKDFFGGNFLRYSGLKPRWFYDWSYKTKHRLNCEKGETDLLKVLILNINLLIKSYSSKFSEEKLDIESTIYSEEEEVMGKLGKNQLRGFAGRTLPKDLIKAYLNEHKKYLQLTKFYSGESLTEAYLNTRLNCYMTDRDKDPHLLFDISSESEEDIESEISLLKLVHKQKEDFDKISSNVLREHSSLAETTEEIKSLVQKKIKKLNAMAAEDLEHQKYIHVQDRINKFKPKFMDDNFIDTFEQRTFGDGEGEKKVKESVNEIDFKKRMLEILQKYSEILDKEKEETISDAIAVYIKILSNSNIKKDKLYADLLQNLFAYIEEEEEIEEEESLDFLSEEEEVELANDEEGSIDSLVVEEEQIENEYIRKASGENYEEITRSLSSSATVEQKIGQVVFETMSKFGKLGGFYYEPLPLLFDLMIDEMNEATACVQELDLFLHESKSFRFSDFSTSLKMPTLDFATIPEIDELRRSRNFPLQFIPHYTTDANLFLRNNEKIVRYKQFANIPFVGEEMHEADITEKFSSFLEEFSTYFPLTLPAIQEKLLNSPTLTEEERAILLGLQDTCTHEFQASNSEFIKFTRKRYISNNILSFLRYKYGKDNFIEDDQDSFGEILDALFSQVISSDGISLSERTINTSQSSLVKCFEHLDITDIVQKITGDQFYKRGLTINVACADLNRSCADLNRSSEEFNNSEING